MLWVLDDADDLQGASGTTPRPSDAKAEHCGDPSRHRHLVGPIRIPAGDGPQRVVGGAVAGVGRSKVERGNRSRDGHLAVYENVAGAERRLDGGDVGVEIW